MAEEIFISTKLVEVEQRSDLWREITRPLFDTVPAPDSRESHLEGSIRARPIGSLLTSWSALSEQQYNRDRRIVLQSGLDGYYLIQLLTWGGVVGDFNDVDVSGSTGDIYIVDLAQTFQSRTREGSRINILIPRQNLERAVNGRNLHGVLLKADWPITQLLMSYLTGLYAVGGQLPESQAEAAQEAVVMLLGSALKGEGAESAADHSLLRTALRQRIIHFIEQNINLPELSPEFIIRRFHISRSHLYRIFSGDGGVARVLRDKRLDAAFLALTSTGAPSLSIAEIAYKLGFSSGNQLLRAFRARFGMTPSEARESAASTGNDRADHNLVAYYGGLRDKLPDLEG